MKSSFRNSYWPHVIAVVVFTSIGIFLYEQWRPNATVGQFIHEFLPSPPVTPALPVTLTQAEIEMKVNALQAQPNPTPVLVINYTGPDSVNQGMTALQDDVIAITNSTPNQITVSFSSGTTLTLGANMSLENSLSQVGNEVVTLKDLLRTTRTTITVQPKL